MLISVEGNIGSGKSTLIKLFKKFNINNFVVLDEPVDQWLNLKDSKGENILGKFYNDKEKYSFPLQIYSFITKLQLLNNNKNAYTIISERSIMTDKNVFSKMLFDDGKIEEINYNIFNELISTIDKNLCIPKFIIYVSTTPQKCYERIHKRNRTEEEKIPLEYLTQCDEYHKKWLDNNEFVIYFDGNVEFEDNYEIFATLLNKLISAINIEAEILLNKI